MDSRSHCECGKEIKIKDSKKMAIIFFIVAVILTPFMIAFYRIGVPFPGFILIVLYCFCFYLFFRKGRFFYICKECGNRVFYPEKPKDL